MGDPFSAAAIALGVLATALGLRNAYQAVPARTRAMAAHAHETADALEGEFGVLKKQVEAYLEAIDQVHERIETKRRRIAATESKRQREETEPAVNMNDRDQVVAHFRKQLLNGG